MYTDPVGQTGRQRGGWDKGPGGRRQNPNRSRAESGTERQIQGLMGFGGQGYSAVGSGLVTGSTVGLSQGGEVDEERLSGKWLNSVCSDV